jgi:hypothetical protein
MPRLRHALIAALLALAAAGHVGPAVAEQQVDLELVLAVDVSLSMDLEEQRLQRDGYVAAFRDAEIHKAIQSGPNGRIAVTYLEWAGAGIQSVVLPWRVLASPDDARAFAAALADKPITRNLMTSVSAAISMSADLFDQNDITGLRRVIDVSGDGPNNSGEPVEDARDAAGKAGIIINGLAIELAPGRGQYSYFDLADLSRYYGDCVITGPGAFVLTITKREEFATAIRQKLLLEIAAAPSGRTRPLFDRVQFKPIQFRPVQFRTVQFRPAQHKYDCLIGEKMWQQYRNDDW